MSCLSTRLTLSWVHGWAIFGVCTASSGRQRFNVLGALYAIAHEVVTNTTYINSESVVTLLQPLAKQFIDHPITVVLDHARYQRNHYVMAEAERILITLMWLPIYSPNLNRIERLEVVQPIIPEISTV